MPPSRPHEHDRQALAEGILERMGDAYSAVDRDYCIVAINAAAERLLRTPRAALIGRSHWEAFPASAKPPFGDALRSAVAEGTEQHLVHHYRGEGHDLHLEVDLYPTADGGAALFWRDVTARTRAQDALRQSEEQYRALFNEMDEAYAVVEVLADAHGAWHDFLFLEVNPAFVRHTGMPYPVGRTAIDLLGTPNPHWAQLYGRAVETGEAIRVEESEMTLGRVFDLNIFRIGGAGSRKVAVLFTDITARKLADAALRTSEQRYRALFEAIDEGFLVVEVVRDAQGQVVDAVCVEANPAASRLTGLSDFSGRRMSELMDEAQAYWVALCGRVAQSGVGERVERFATVLGRWFDCYVSPAADVTRRDGGPARVAIVFQEVTARHQAEQALRESEARFRALAEASPALIWTLGADGALDYVNVRWVDVTGVEVAQLRGNGWHRVLHPDDAPGYLDAIGSLREGAPMQRRVRLRGRDGGYRWFESHWLPWFAQAGQARGLVGIALDVEDAVQAEHALRTADRHKDEFLATLAHELRNPLAPISSALQFLRFDGGRRRADRLLAMIERQVRQMVRLIDDLMDVTRIGRGKVDLQRSALLLSEVLDSAMEASQLAFQHKRQQVTVDNEAGALVLHADKARLIQVFSNLLNNAAKYTPHEGQIRLAAWRDGADAVVEVSDSGMGIPAQQLTRVFEMFSQPHGRNGHTDSGLGIGLAMVRSLVGLHGGRVEARSAGPGLGSAFTVHLPLYDGPADRALAAPDPGRPHARLAGRRVLVVDDNRDAADALCQVLESQGALATPLYGGPEALAALDRLRPDVVVLDLGMPVMDGCEVARRIRRDHPAAAMRLIALSGWGQPADRERTQRAGFDHHLTKPAQMDELMALLSA